MDNEWKETVNRIREARLRAGLSQAEFARLTGFSLSYVKKIESGDRPLTVPFLKAVCGSLGLSADFLLYGEAPGDVWESVKEAPDAERLELARWLYGHFAGR